jgi:hypothetical protein
MRTGAEVRPRLQIYGFPPSLISTSITRASSRSRRWMCRAPVPFCRQTPLTLKALRAKDYSENPETLGEHLKKRRALAIFAAVQGAQLVARSRGDVAIYDAIVETYRMGVLLP